MRIHLSERRAGPVVVWPALAARLSGPGGYYNIGNALGLVMGLSIQIWAADAAGGVGGPVDAALSYLAGSGSSVALTVATLIFFCSGEAYHRAWAGPGSPRPGLIRLGDLLSGFGAVAFGLALIFLGNPLLAATAGVLHALGKFASSFHAIGTPPLPGWPRQWIDPFRMAVLASRVPAMIAAITGMSLVVGHIVETAQAGTALVCTILWARADLLLLASSLRTTRPTSST